MPKIYEIRKDKTCPSFINSQCSKISDPIQEVSVSNSRSNRSLTICYATHFTLTIKMSMKESAVPGTFPGIAYK